MRKKYLVNLHSALGNLKTYKDLYWGQSMKKKNSLNLLKWNKDILVVNNSHVCILDI